MGGSDGSNRYISKSRLETLVDGIFVIAMTLLVLIYLYHILSAH